MTRETPFFVVGSPRSGTTLLRRLLCAHPRLYLPGETGFVPFLRVDAQRSLTPAQVASVVRRIGRLNRFWAHEEDDLASLPAEPRLGDVLSMLYQRRALAHGAARWGDKTPGYVRYLPILDAIFPDCRVIHLIRDGRDVALSARAEWGSEKWYMDLPYLLRQWRLNVRRGRLDGRPLGPERYLEVRYEELARRPLEAMGTVLEFLGEPWHEAVAEAANSGAAVSGSRFHANVHRPVSTASVDRWRRELSEREAKLADWLVGDLLASLGYGASGLGALTFGEWLASLPGVARYAVTGPARRLLYAAGLLTLNRGLRIGGKGS